MHADDIEKANAAQMGRQRLANLRRLFHVAPAGLGAADADRCNHSVLDRLSPKLRFAPAWSEGFGACDADGAAAALPPATQHSSRTIRGID